MASSGALVAPPLIIYAMMGSQYVFKVLAALQANQVDHYVHLVPMGESERRKVLPSGGLLVPELQIGLGKDHRTVVSDSEEILLHLVEQAKRLPAHIIYPNEQAKQVSKRASDGTLAAMVWYYNWVDPTGYQRSMRRQVGSAVPWCIPYFVIDLLLKSTRTKHEGRVLRVLPDADLKDEASMRKRLQEELQYFDTLLQTDGDDQPFLIPGTTEPSAADFSCYALMERLVGDEATPSSDYPIFPAVLELKTEDPWGLTKLWKWHDHMRTTYKVQFKGKRVPKDMVSQL